jgi:phosphoserine aminotransferase
VTDRTWNFSAGPGVLPVPVLEQVQRDVLCLPGVGAGPFEVSHRGAWFTEVLEQAEADLRALLRIGPSYRVWFVPGGASLQFSMIAMNLLRGASTAADFVVTGAWARKALAEASKEGATRVAWTGEPERFVRTPADAELREALDPAAAYVHVTTNETIQGVEFPQTPWVPPGVPLVADVSSDFCSRPLEVDRYGVIYAGAQKNAGPAGVAIVICHEDLLARVPEGLPSMLDYRTWAEHGSTYNTPPVFAIYVVGLVLRWLREDVGGVDAIAARNREKAALLYDAIDGSDGFYRGHAEAGSRSRMNVTWRLPAEDLERRFLAEATAAGLAELKGHRSVGGIRASIYNAMPFEGVQTLVDFMDDFRARAG